MLTDNETSKFMDKNTEISLISIWNQNVEECIFNQSQTGYTNDDLLSGTINDTSTTDTIINYDLNFTIFFLYYFFIIHFYNYH